MKELWVVVSICITVAFVTLAGSCTITDLYQTKKIAEAKDPMAASCGIHVGYEGRQATCITYIMKEKN